MAQELESILTLLLSPDTQVIRQATAQLQSIHKDPALIEALWEVLLNSENPSARQFSAVLLRKKLGKVWKRLSATERERFKMFLIQCLTNEFHHLALRSIANLVSVIANYEFTHGQWAELSQFIMSCYQSTDPVKREVGLMVLSSVMESCALQLKPQYPQLITLLGSALEDMESKSVSFFALQCLTTMVEYIGDDETALFRQIISKSIDAIKRLIIVDEDKACEAMDLFDELIEIEVAILVPYLETLIQFCLEIASNANLGDGIRVRGLNTIMWLVAAKKKSVLKKGLIPSLLTALLNIMVTDKDDDDVDDELLDNKTQLPHSVASQVIDKLALCLPPEKVFTPLMQLIQPWLQTEALPSQRRAALISIAVISEGCSEIIKKNNLPGLVQCIYWSMKDSNQGVRNAALFALGQFSEHFQPEITQFSSDLLPALFQFLEQLLAGAATQHQLSVTRIFYALETFCEQMDKELLPYLPGLTEKLFLLLMGDFNLHYKELGISCIGAIANAVKSHFVPYFAKAVEVLKEFISLPQHQDYVVIQAQAIDTLGVLATAVGSEVFRPLSEECVQLGMVLMQSSDPDLRRSVYGMLASLSGILKESMVPHLQRILERMVECLQSDEGIKAKYSSFAVQFLDFDEEEEESGVEDVNDSQCSLEDDQDIEGYTIENAYLEEKEDACNAIGEIARNLGIVFLPFIDDCFKEINVLSEDSMPGIRKASVTAITELCLVWYNPAVVSRMDENEKCALDKLVNITLLDMSAGARTDNDSVVVATILDNLEKLLKAINGRGFAIEEKVVESLLVTVDDIFSSKAQCQDEDDNGDGLCIDGEMAEMDGVLLESAGSLLGPLAKIVGGPNILNSLKPLINKLKSKITINSQGNEKSFVNGTLAEIVDGCGPSSVELFDELYPLLMSGIADSMEEVVSNSVYGVGVLMANGVPKSVGKYQEVLQVLFNVLQNHSSSGRVIDNVCAAVCRMIVSCKERVPLDQVIPVLLQRLPLKVDHEETTTIYGCILSLLQQGEISLINNLDLVLKVFAAELLPTSQLSEEMKAQVVDVIRALSNQCCQQFTSAITSLSHQQAQIIAQFLSSSTNS